MVDTPRKPPLRLVARLRRALGGQAGWGGVVIQILFVAAVVWIGYEIVENARANLQAQRIASGFGFLSNTASFAVSQALIPFSESDTYARVFVVGLLNTLLVSIVGIVIATIIGVAVALGRLSPNWLLARISGGYVELIRNLPLLFQILFWYLAVLATLPNPRQSISLFGSVFLSNRGLIVPGPVPQPSFGVFAVAIAIGIAASLAMHAYARHLLFAKGEKLTIWPFALAMLVGLPALAALMFGAPLAFDMPQLRGFNFAGGVAHPAGIRRADHCALDLHRRIHRRDRARRHSVRAEGSDGGGGVARSHARADAAAGRHSAGDARDPAAADQPVSQPHQELVARRRHRLSGPVLGVRRHGA